MNAKKCKRLRAAMPPGSTRRDYQRIKRAMVRGAVPIEVAPERKRKVRKPRAVTPRSWPRTGGVPIVIKPIRALALQLVERGVAKSRKDVLPVLQRRYGHLPKIHIDALVLRG
jgi:hypothetical protein